MDKYPNGTPDKFIHDVSFDNVLVEGEPVLGWDNKHLFTNNTDDLKLVYDFHFSTTNSIDELKVKPQHNGKCYSIDGRQIAKPTKGLYIRDGKKIFLK